MSDSKDNQSSGQSRSGQQERRQCVRIMEQLLGKSWEANGYGPDGYDCYGMIHDYLTRLGAKTISEWKGVTLDNYTDFYRKDRKVANGLLLEVFDQLGIPVPLKSQTSGDIVIIRNTKTNDLYPGIYAGNGNAMMAIINRGVVVVPVDRKLFRIIAVRRPNGT